MPVGPYETFAQCVAVQRRKGHSLDSARRICGEIEKRTQKGSEKMPHHTPEERKKKLSEDPIMKANKQIIRPTVIEVK